MTDKDTLTKVFAEYQKDSAFRAVRRDKNFVPGVGAKASPALILVGEAPGPEEDIEARPFVGPSGKMLDTLLAQNSMEREFVYITNVVKWHPVDERGKTRTPTASEVDAARPYLRRELALVGKKAPSVTGKEVRPIVCLLGKTAGLLLGKGHGLARGEVTVRKGWRYAYLYHPAVALYDPKMKDTLREHFRQVCKYI